jgi:2-hydroxychromene-2-carboxylate isomerase
MRGMALDLTLYVDPQSPYAYLAEARAARVLGAEPTLQPVALGAIFVKRGWGSWAHTDGRADHVAAVEARAAAAGLPPLTWHEDWPAQTLAPARATAWAHRQGHARAFLRAYRSRVFAQGAPPGAVETLAEAAGDAGLEAAQLPDALGDQELKDALRSWTDAAWDRGVRGIPTLAVGEQLFYGDDQLETAAADLPSQDPAA